MDETFYPLTPTAIKNVKVRVDPSQGVVRAIPPELHMGGEHFQSIQWTIETDGWVFPTFRKGIELKVDDPQFTNGSVDPGNPQIFRISDTNLVAGDHPYTVLVQNASTGQVLPLDPTIKNQA